METPPVLPDSTNRSGPLASLAALAAIPEEEVWLASQKSARTRRAYRQDVTHFMRTLGIASPEQLRQVDHRAVIAWERIMREQEGSAPSTVRRRLAALSSLFKHLVPLHRDFDRLRWATPILHQSPRSWRYRGKRAPAWLGPFGW